MFTIEQEYNLARVKSMGALRKRRNFQPGALRIARRAVICAWRAGLNVSVNNSVETTISNIGPGRRELRLVTAALCSCDSDFLIFRCLKNERRRGWVHLNYLNTEVIQDHMIDKRDRPYFSKLFEYSARVTGCY